MKSIYLTFLLFISAQFSFAQQTISIDYKITTNMEKAGKFEIASKLISNEKEALFIEYFENVKQTQNDEEGNTTINASANDQYMIKDYTENALYYENMVMLKFFPTKDPIYIFDWDIDKKTEEILGYTCQAAVTEFRGRTYVAYFTNELGFSGGPWKFDGLPGMILKVYSLDGVVKFEAQAVEVKKSLFEIENVFKEMKKLITYEEFKEIYKNKYHEVNRTEITESGGTLTRSMPACQIECHVVE